MDYRQSVLSLLADASLYFSLSVNHLYTLQGNSLRIISLGHHIHHERVHGNSDSFSYQLLLLVSLGETVLTTLKPFLFKSLEHLFRCIGTATTIAVLGNLRHSQISLAEVATHNDECQPLVSLKSST